MSTRATSIEHPTLRIGAFLVALILLAMPVPVLGAKGTAVVADVNALIDAVSPNETTAFRASFTNGGTSNITQLSFTGSITSGSFQPDLLPAGCTPSGTTTVTCVLGSVAAGAPTVALDFYVLAPASGSVAFTGTFSADAAQNNGKAQKRDTWGPYSDFTSVDPDSELFARWQTAHGALRLPPAGFIGRASYQESAVQVPAFGGEYPARVAHVAQSITCSNLGMIIAGLGYAVDLSIADGNSPVGVTIRYTPDASERKPASQVAVVHEKDDGTCSFPARTATATCDFAVFADGCYQATTEGNGANRTLVVTMQLPSNGKIKGF